MIEQSNAEFQESGQTEFKAHTWHASSNACGPILLLNSLNSTLCILSCIACAKLHCVDIFADFGYHMPHQFVRISIFGFVFEWKKKFPEREKQKNGKKIKSEYVCICLLFRASKSFWMYLIWKNAICLPCTMNTFSKQSHCQIRSIPAFSHSVYI